MLNAIDKSLAERDANVDKFCTHLDKDIAELSKELKEVKTESQVHVFENLLIAIFFLSFCVFLVQSFTLFFLFQNPMILDAASDKAMVRKTLDKMHDQMKSLQDKAFTYKSYQKNFKVRQRTREKI